MSSTAISDKPVVVLDVDDTLLDWIHSFILYLERTYGYVKTRPLTSHEYAFANWYDGVAPSRLAQLASEFNRTREFANLPELPGARELIRLLSDAGFDVIAVTACGDDPQVYDARAAQIEALGISSYRILPLGTSKIDVFRSLRPTLVVDDHVRHCISALHVGAHGALVHHPINEFSRKNGLPDRVETAETIGDIAAIAERIRKSNDRIVTEDAVEPRVFGRMTAQAWAGFPPPAFADGIASHPIRIAARMAGCVSPVSQRFFNLFLERSVSDFAEGYREAVEDPSATDEFGSSAIFSEISRLAGNWACADDWISRIEKKPTKKPADLQVSDAVHSVRPA